MRPKPKALFIPPRPTPWLITLSRWALPACLRHYRVASVEYRAEDLERLRALGGERVALFPNHPTGLDPAILYDVAKQARQPFYFLAAREVFDFYHGLWGWVVQHVGGYSIVRGAVDRAAFKTTRELLAQPGGKVVIFPEGQTYSQNDSLLPFHNGTIQLAFWAQDDVAATAPEASVYLLPVAVKYKYLHNMRPQIETVLTTLEQALGLAPYTPDMAAAEEPPPSPPPPDADLYPRLRRIGAAVVSRLEVEYGLKPAPGARLFDRMLALKQAIVVRVAEALHITPQGDTLPDQLRYLANTLYQVTDEEPRDLCSYDRHLWEERRRRLQPLMRDLDRLANWIAVYDGYVSAHPSVERMADLIRRLETEVLGPFPRESGETGLLPVSRLTGWQRCLVRLGEPLRLADFREAYQSDKRATVESVTRRLEGEVQELLDELA